MTLCHDTRTPFLNLMHQKPRENHVYLFQEFSTNPKPIVIRGTELEP
uniref:Uncharacterized protein n=1 Tax=Anguilla anguilla TaxID=7936 RepID=A0A0E9V3I6_ANGAN